MFQTKDDAGKPLVLEVACWAHARRKFFEAQDSEDREIALTALKAIGELYAVERTLAGVAASRKARNRAAPEYEQIAKFRKRRSWPLLETLHAWLEQAKTRVLPNDPLGDAINCAMGIWNALTRYTEQGYLSIDKLPEATNRSKALLCEDAAEPALRDVVIGRKNCLVAGFAKGMCLLEAPLREGSRGGRWAAIAYTLIKSAKRCGANPWEYLRDVLERVQAARPSEFKDFLPDAWQNARTQQSA